MPELLKTTERTGRMMRILALGDVVGKKTVDFLGDRLWSFRKTHAVDAVVANGENASEIRGICSGDAKKLLESGVDVITLGNHAFGKRDLYSMLDQDNRIIRPANFPPEAPGMGHTVLNLSGWRILVMNVNGRAFMDSYSDPFVAVERILNREAGKYDYSVLDIHAEATSEKLAIARVFDGKINVIFGTHTHVTTADEQILPNGTAYQTDLGMCGPVNGIIGTASDCVIAKFRTQMPVAFSVADGPIKAHGTIFTLENRKAVSVQRVTF